MCRRLDFHTQSHPLFVLVQMPPQIRATFMPNPPLEHYPPVTFRRKNPITGVSAYMKYADTSPPPPREVQETAQSKREKIRQQKAAEHAKKLEPLIAEYRKMQKEQGGEYEGMNCYNTLFVGRLAFEVDERKLLREMEAFGAVKYIKIPKDAQGKSRGFAFVEYEHEDDMKRAYRVSKQTSNVDGQRVPKCRLTLFIFELFSGCRWDAH